MSLSFTGANDAPVIVSTAPPAMSGVVNAVADEHAEGPAEGTPVVVTGTIDFTDAEFADVHSYTVAADGGGVGYAGALTVSQTDPATGDGAGQLAWTFTIADTALNGLAEGQALATSPQVYVITITDNHGATATQTVSIAITGTNDAPDITSSVSPLTFTEAAGVTGSSSALAPDALITTSGTITFNDDDIMQDASDFTVTVAAAVTAGSGPAGVLPAELADWLTTSGLTNANNATTGAFNWSFAAPQDQLFDYLGAGQSVTITYTLSLNDGFGVVDTVPISVTITGTNDTPVAVADTKSGSEDATITGTVATNDSDIDDGAILTYTLTAPVAGLTLNGYGTYSFDASNAAYQHLAQGATGTVVANYTVTDEHGATSTSTLTITLTGTNDAPVAVADTKSGSEDAIITGTVANDTDIDDSAILTYTLNASVAGLTLNGDGSYSFDASNAAYQHRHWVRHRL
ncbi:MAG: cadherin-like domain-containing protein [Phyllobacteriaceae bacterium]|nr:cadherin-like domain-containing protein [Phyllobacteriaceae bacterium]